jgi:endonuclease/exonuclease/phosphatase family metal-dependent hydrolase
MVINRKLFAFIVIALTALSLNAQDLKWARKPIRIGTYNIKYPAKKPAWTDRLPAIVRLLEDNDFDVFGAQEPFLPQIEDIMKYIGKEYSWVGDCTTGDNTYRKAHFNPIFYKKKRLELLDHGVIWFTPEPGKPGYGAMYSRNCVWAKFKDKKTRKIFYQFNCHFDHKGVYAREKSAEIILEQINEIAGGYPCVVSGDFNAKQDSKAYKIMAESGVVVDALYQVENPVNAQYYSMSHYKPMDTVPLHGLHLDHVFYTKSNSKAASWHMITDNLNGQFGSDHFPILIEWYIANSR